MQILVACEESQAVTIALRKLGHEAYSCDLIPCSGGHPEWHIQQDVLPLLNGYCFFKTCDGSAHYVLGRWDMLIAFPPCTYLTNASAVRMRVKGEIVAERYAKAMEAKAFFVSFLSADCAKIAVENPTPLKIVELPPYTQAIQPWQFGHPYTKRTCLWLKELPPAGPHRNHHGGCHPMGKWRMQRRTWELPALSRPQRTGPHQQGQNFPRHSRRNGGTMGRARDYLIISPPAVCGGGAWEAHMKYIASCSFGKDSLAMVLMLIERGLPLDEVVFYDTGMEFQAIYDLRDDMLPIFQQHGIKYTTLYPDNPFLYDMLERPVKGRERRGYGWCGGLCRWGTTCKLRTIDQYAERQGAKVYVGIAADETPRLQKERKPYKLFPLAEFGMTEADCLQYCYSAGYFWLEGSIRLYDILDRVSCWCCCNKNLKELRNIRQYLPEYWEKLKHLQAQLERPMKGFYKGQPRGVFELDERFAREDRDT